MSASKSARGTTRIRKVAAMRLFRKVLCSTDELVSRQLSDLYLRSVLVARGLMSAHSISSRRTRRTTNDAVQRGNTNAVDKRRLLPLEY